MSTIETSLETHRSTSGLNSIFGTLPSEVKNLIYHYVFFNGSVTLFRDIPDNKSLQPSPLLNLVFTSRRCYQEAKPVFYRQTAFHLRLGHIFGLKGPTYNDVRDKFGQNARYVSHVYYYGADSQVILNIERLFPSLKLLEMSLGEDFFHSDQTNFDRAMRYALRYGEWNIAMQVALDERFCPGMRDAVARLRQLGPKRGFRVLLHWSMAYRFVDFRGETDLDEWILRVWDPDGTSRKVYEIAQQPLEPTWCEGRLTLPCVSSNG